MAYGFPWEMVPWIGPVALICVGLLIWDRHERKKELMR